MKRPSLQFYPGDWLKDPAVRSVSLAARGLWIDMLCLMHECADRGHLRSASGSAITEIQLARMVGASPTEIRRVLSELESAGVFSRTEDATIYSRRMVRDTRLMDIRRQCGALGGNPNLVGKKVNQSSGDDGLAHDNFSLTSSANVNASDEHMENSKTLSAQSSHPNLVGDLVNQNGNQSLTPSSSSSTSVKTPIAPKGARSASESERRRWFEEQFWPVVWAKIGVGAARTAWLRKVTDQAKCILVVEAAKRQCSSILERGSRPGSSVLHPSTWLNQERYFDEDPTTNGSSAQPAMRLMA
jgi:hypothetical protein